MGQVQKCGEPAREEESDSQFEVVIAGAGIGGLATAIAFANKAREAHRERLRIRIIERDTAINSRAQGYSLTIQHTGMGALNKLGMARQVRAEAGGIQMSGQHIIDAKSGKVLLALGGNKAKKASGSNVFLPRERLRSILYERAVQESVAERSVVETIIDWGKTIVSFCDDDTSSKDQSPPKLKIHLSDDTAINNVDLLIAGEGARSEIRNMLLADKLNFLKVVSICGINETEHPLCLHGSVQVFDPSTNSRLFSKPFDNCQQASVAGDHVSHSSTIGGSSSSSSIATPRNTTQNDNTLARNTVMWQLTVPQTEEQIMEMCYQRKNEQSHEPLLRMQTFVKSVVSAWDSSIKDFVLSTPVEKLRGGALYDRDPEAVGKATEIMLNAAHAKSNARVVFIGDAAHPMSPFKGQGANSALVDAVELADAVFPDGDHGVSGCASNVSRDCLIGALDQYHKRMSKRVSRFVLGSRRNVEFTHSSHAGELHRLFDNFGVKNFAAESTMRNKVLEINKSIFPDRKYETEKDIYGDKRVFESGAHPLELSVEGVSSGVDCYGHEIQGGRS